MKRFAVLITLFLMLTSTARAATWVYVSIAGENKIAVYQLDEKSGELRHASDIKVSGGPGAMGVDPEKKFLFASIRSVGNVAGFKIDPQTGQLSLVNEVPAGADPSYVATDKTGKYLLSAYYQAGKVLVHGIDGSGKLSAEPIQSVPTDEKAHAILTDKTNKYAFVPHTGPNAIFQFRFDDRTGKLTANEKPKAQRPENTGPRHLWFHPKKNLVYIDNEQASSVTVYRLRKKEGTLKPIQTVSTLPDGFQGNNSNADIEISPDGRFVYAANRGHDSIAGFAVDEKSGKLTSIG